MSYTFVTGLIDLGRRESRPGTKQLSDYLALARPLLDSGLPLCVFVEPHVKELLADCENRTNLTFMTIDETRLDSDYEEYKRYDLPKVRDPVKDTHWYMLTQAQKTRWMVAASSANRFSTDSFCWVDFGINHNVRLDAAAYHRTLSRFRPARPDEIIVPFLSRTPLPGDLREEVFINSFQSFVAGSNLAGGRDMIAWLDSAQTQKIREFQQVHGTLTWESNIWSVLLHENPQLFTCYRARWNADLIRSFPTIGKNSIAAQLARALGLR